jgi:hypothetical protein
MGIQHSFEFFGDFADSLVPGYPLEVVPHPFQGIENPVCIVLVICHIEPFSADVPLTPGIVLVGADLDDPVVLDLYLQTAVLATERTIRYFPGHDFPSLENRMVD